MTASQCLIQFFHPGVEFDRHGDLASWTSAEQGHSRKFMLHRGAALRGTEHFEGELAFWGEWEPQAACVATFASTEPGLPRRAWRPYWDATSAPVDRLNTDPMVFGGFRYSVCQQHRRHGAGWRQTRMQRLSPGSVILFGSHSSGGFVLDTVFVVSRSVKHTARSYQSLGAPPEYVDVVLSTLYLGESGTDCCKAGGPEDEYTLYDGATIHEPRDGLFSFVPCLPADTRSFAFARPTIKHDLLSLRQQQGYGVPVDGDANRNQEVWRDVRDQVLGAGLWLGTAFDFPANK